MTLPTTGAPLWRDLAISIWEMLDRPGRDPWKERLNCAHGLNDFWTPVTVINCHEMLVLTGMAMAPHSSTLAWKISSMEEPSRLQSMGSLSRTRLSNFTFTFRFHALEKDIATHSSVLAWRIPGMGEPGGLPSLGSQRVGHNWCDLAAAADWQIHLLMKYSKPERLHLPPNTV